MSDDSRCQADPEIAALLSQALNQSTPVADATDMELAVVAEQGIEGIPESDRDRVLNAIAANRDGEIAAALLHVDLAVGLATGDRSATGASTSAPLRFPGRFYRVARVGWALAACLTVAAGLRFATGWSDLSSQPLGTPPANGLPTPMSSPAPASEAEQIGHASSSNGLNALLLLSSVLVLLGCTILVVRLRKATHSEGSTR
jgi:hypothetical protein